MGWNRDSLGTRALACAMSLVLAVGLVPAPAFAEVVDEAAAGSQLVAGVPEDDGIAGGAGAGDEQQAIAPGGEDVAGDSDEAILAIDDEQQAIAPGGEDVAGDSDAAILAIDDGQTDVPAFEGEQVVDGVRVTVRAEAGTFPAGAELSVAKATREQEEQAGEAVDDARDEGVSVAASYTFDIKVIHPETGEEYQPAEGQTVSVSFALAEVADENLETQVYHVTEDVATGELAAESLDVNTEITPETGEATTAVVETDGFSIYTVEFTYNNLEYVLPGSTSVPMSEILTAVGLTGEVTAAEVSDASLFSASDETGEWIVAAHQPFSTTELMKVTINGVVYEITVTDDGEITTWADLQAALSAGGSVTMTQNITASSSDSALTVPSGKTVTLDLNGFTIDRGLYNQTTNNPTANGYVIKNSGTLTIRDTSTTQTGKITGGNNSNNYSPYGGGIYNGGTLTLESGAISGNHAHDCPGVYNDFPNGVSFTMNGGAISGNVSDKGGAGVGNYGTFTMNGGTISGNNAVTRGGGVWSMGTFTMTGGTIENNTAGDNGGGVCVRWGYATISGGVITGNRAAGTSEQEESSDDDTRVGGCGGGLYMDQNCEVTLSGGTITGNTASNKGGDVYLHLNGSSEPVLKMQGSPVANVYLAEGKVITVSGAFTEGAGIAVSTAAGTGVFTSGYGTNNGEVHPSQYFHASDASNGILLSDGEAALAAGVVNNVPYVERGWDGASVVTETKTTDAVAVPSNGSMTSGWYYLNSNVTKSDRVSLTGDTYLILGDNYTLNLKGLYIPQGCTLTIYAQSDGDNAGKLISKATSNGAGIGGKSGSDNGNIVIHGGNITAEGHANCAGIGTNDGKTGGSITIYGGDVTAHGGDDGAGIGGGKNCDGGAIAIYGGTVNAEGGGKNGAGIGGGNNGDGGTITIWGGTVTANGPIEESTGENGAGIGGGNNGTGGTITIHGGTVTTYSRDGAGIGGGDDGDGGSITINGGTITSTKVNEGWGARIGGGAQSTNGRTPTAGTIIINGGTITTEGGSGAGIGGGKRNTSGGKVTINGGVINASGSYGIGKGEDGSDIEISLGYTTSTWDTISITGNISTNYITLSKSFKSSDDAETYEESTYQGTYAAALLTRMNGKTLVAAADYEIHIYVPSGKHGRVTASALHAIEGATITLTPVGDPGYVVAPFNGNEGDGLIVYRSDTDPIERIDVSDDYKFTMPPCDVYVFANFVDHGTVPYLGLDGEMHDATVSYITDDISEWKADTWYAVTQDAVINEQVSLKGEGVNLILCDGATLTAKKGIMVNSEQSLTIWAQSNAQSNGNAGKLIADGRNAGSGYYYPGIGGYGATSSPFGVYSGSITINGGKITAYGAQYAAGIGGSLNNNAGQITINGGVIDAYSGMSAAAIGNGSQAIGGYVTINGGTVNAQSVDSYAYGIGGNKEDQWCIVTIALSSMDDSVTASSYHQCRLTLSGNYVDQDETPYPDGTFYKFDDKTGLPNKTLKLAGVHTVTFAAGNAEATGTMKAQTVPFGRTYTLPECGFTMPLGWFFEGWQVGDDTELKQEGETITINADTVITAVWKYWDGYANSWERLQVGIEVAENGSVITLSDDCVAESTDTVLIIPSDKQLTIDLKGFAIDRNLFPWDPQNNGCVIRNEGTLTIIDSKGGGTITGGYNKDSGGGIDNSGTLTLSGGTICDNESSQWGGGIYLRDSANAVLNLNGGIIEKNICGKNGAGVHVSGKAVINVSGEPKITGNNKYDDGYIVNNINLASGALINVTDALTDGANLCVSKSDKTGVVTNGLPGKGSVSNFSSDDKDLMVGLNASGEAILGTPATITFAPGDESATGEMEAEDVPVGTEYPLPDCEYAVEGKVFKEWSVVVGDAEPVTKAAGEKIAVTSATTATAVWADAVAVAAYSSDEDCTASVADVGVSPGGPVAQGASVTVTAPEKDGWTFMGWYPVTGVDGETGLVSAYDADGLLSSNPEYTFNVTSDTSVVAVYRAAVEKVTVKISQANGAQFRVGDSETVHSGAYTMDVPLGTTVTATAVDADKVLHWTNESDKIVGTGATLEFTVIRAMEVTLFYNTPNERQSYVEFVSDYDQVLSGSMQYSTSDTIAMADAPLKTGYTFVKWVFEGTDDEATPDTIKAKIGTEGNDVITCKPTYTKDTATATVTVKYLDADGQSVKEQESTAGLAIGSGHTVTAPTIENHSFSCWKDEAGNVLGYGESYFMQVTTDATVIASYVSSGTAVEAKPVITIGVPYRTSSGSLHKVSCAATRSVPEGYTVVEQGMLYARDVNGLDEASFVYGTDGVGRYQGNTAQNDGVLYLNVKVSTDNVVAYFRGYMVLRNASTGELETYYSGIASASYGSLVN